MKKKQTKQLKDFPDEISARKYFKEKPFDKPKWEEEFDKLPIEAGIGCSGNHQEIKSFTRTLLSDQQGELYAWFNKALLKQKKENYEKCLEIINHSIGKDDAYKEILKLLKN